MTRVEHVVSPAADVTVRPAIPGGHEIAIYDGITTVVLRFASARLLAGFVAPVNTYLLGTDGGGGYGALPLGDMASTGRWEDQGSAGKPVGDSGEGGSVATTRALPADPDRSPEDAWEIDEEALTRAHVAVEDELVEWRDSGRSTLGPANGFVIRDRDGTISPIMRFGTRDGLRIGIRAYLNALSARSIEGGA